jgi:hypothetical protein
MAKRFTDNEKWKDAWFSDLPSKYKLFWLYILDDCNHAGIWKVNFRVAQFMIGESLEVSEVKRYLKDRVEVIDDEYWFICKFLKFQYPNGLKESVKAQLSVIKLLKQYNLTAIVNNQLGDNYATIQPDKKETVELNYIDLLKTEHSYLDGLYMKFKIRKGTIPAIILKFKEHLKVYPANHENLKDFKNHFANWIGTEVGKGRLSSYIRGHQKGDL